MLHRSHVILLSILLTAVGGWLGYLGFEEAARFISPGSVSFMVKYPSNARQLAHTCFAVTSGLLAFSAALSALIAGRFRTRVRYLDPMLTGLLIGVITSAIALLYYRSEMQSLGIKVGEFITLVKDSKRQIALNPLTRSLLFGTTMTLLAGLVRGLVSPSSGKR